VRQIPVSDSLGAVAATGAAEIDEAPSSMTTATEPSSWTRGFPFPFMTTMLAARSVRQDPASR
jgi:hypothetical protein